MSATKGRKNLLKSLLKAHLSLGCGCSDSNRGRPKVYEPMPIPRPNSEASLSSSSPSSDGGGKTSTTFSPAVHYCSDEPGPSERAGPSPDKIEHSIPVVKESEDPYEDFRESMMQMIMEKEIYTQEDLHHLLRRFLRLNAAAHRPLILRAFVDVCHSLISADPDDQGGGNRRRTCEQPSLSPTM